MGCSEAQKVESSSVEIDQARSKWADGDGPGLIQKRPAGGTGFAPVRIMIYVSDETFGPVLFGEDSPLILVCGSLEAQETFVALEAALEIDAVVPFMVRVAFLSPEAGPALRRKLGLGPRTSMLYFKEAREVARIVGKKTKREIISEFLRHEEAA